MQKEEVAELSASSIFTELNSLSSPGLSQCLLAVDVLTYKCTRAVTPGETWASSSVPVSWLRVQASIVTLASLL